MGEMRGSFRFSPLAYRLAASCKFRVMRDGLSPAVTPAPLASPWRSTQGLSKKPADFVNRIVDGPGDYCEQSVNDESLESASLDDTNTNYIYPQGNAGLAGLAIPMDRMRTDDTIRTMDTAAIQQEWKK